MTDTERMIRHPWALVLAGGAAAVLVVGNPVGLGTFLSAVAVAVAVAAQAPRHLERPVAVDTGLALSLAATPVVTTAGWVLGLALVAAFGFGALAVAGGRSWGELAVATWAPVRATWPAVREVSGSLGDRIGGDAGRPSTPLLRGAGLALVLVTVFGTLFVTADRAFAELTARYLVPDWDLGLLPARVVVGALVTVGAAALVVAPRRVRGRPARPAERGLARTEWVTALVSLDLLFAAFVAVQLTVLFGGHTHVLETTGLTYAEYAREGFAQLLVAAGLTFAVIAGSVRWSRRGDARDRWLLQALLGVLCVLSLVVLGSALRRLDLYEQAYGFTRARMLAHGVLVWFGALFALVVAAGLRWDARWLPRATVAPTGVALLVFALARPDAAIAEHNVRRFEDTGRIDVAYLAGLSADAVPALVGLPAELHPCVLADDAMRVRGRDPWHAVNLSRRRARTALDGLGGLDGLGRLDGLDGTCRAVSSSGS